MVLKMTSCQHSGYGEKKGRGSGPQKKKKAGKMRAKTCIKGLGDVTIQNSRNTFFQSSV